jgi:hypothetical protein
MKKLLSLAAMIVSMVVLSEKNSQAQYFDAYSGLNDIAAANMNFDAQFWSQYNATQQQASQQHQQFMQQLMAHPEVQNGYRQYLASGGQAALPEYAWWWAMTAGGTNIQGAIDAQNQRFAGLQQAHRTIQEGHQSYNDGYHDNQVRMDNLFDRMSTARRGEWYYTHPETGETMKLPYTATSGYYETRHGTLFIDNTGRHFLNRGYGWTEVNMNGG